MHVRYGIIYIKNIFSLKELINQNELPTHITFHIQFICKIICLQRSFHGKYIKIYLRNLAQIIPQIQLLVNT